MAKNGKKHGGKHKTKPRRSMNSQKSRNSDFFDSDEDIGGNATPSMRNIGRRPDAFRHDTTSNLRNRTMTFVKSSEGPYEQEDAPKDRKIDQKRDQTETSEEGIMEADDFGARLIIANLHAQFSEADVLQLSQAHGEVKWCEIIRNERGTSTGKAIVDMERVESARSFTSALHGESVQGCTLHVERCQIPSELPTSPARQNSKATNALRHRTESGLESVHNSQLQATGPAIRQPPDITKATEAHDAQASGSDDEVVFHGRNASLVSSRVPSVAPDMRRQAPNTHVASRSEAKAMPVAVSMAQSQAIAPEIQSNLLRLFGPGVAQSNQDKPTDDIVKPLRQPSQNPEFTIDESLFRNRNGVEAMLDDYVENARRNGEMSDIADEPNDDAEWTRSDLDDFDDLSTSHAREEGIESIIHKRVRDSGVQYLIVWEGDTVDEARWIHRDALTMPGAEELIAAFEEEEKFMEELRRDEDNDEDSLDDDAGSEDSSSDAEDEGTDGDADFEDERDLIERKMARMSDERIAKLLAKQEELGLGSDELMLFDDAPDDWITQDSDEIKLDRRGRKKGRRRGKVKLVDDDDELFRMTEAFNADEGYDSFDIMDMGQISLMDSKKKRGKNPDFGLLSDPELEQALRETWAADRQKKKMKKAEREELRAAGLLGKKGKKAARMLDPAAGPNMIPMSIRRFLDNDDQQQLSLPPMTKQERKIIHEMCNMIGLKSKSAGNGRGRFPTLFKTSRTITDLDDRTLQRITKRLHGRPPGKAPRFGGREFGSFGKQRGGGGKTSGTTYMEGETVGAGASEIGGDNRGRMMLEKMGWSKGMVLGALGNERGILQPIEHVVKNSRAGLG